MAEQDGANGDEMALTIFAATACIIKSLDQDSLSRLVLNLRHSLDRPPNLEAYATHVSLQRVREVLLDFLELAEESCEKKEHWFIPAEKLSDLLRSLHRPPKITGTELGTVTLYARCVTGTNQIYKGPSFPFSTDSNSHWS